MEQSYMRFPLFVDLTGKRVVVVGGGTVACRRVGVLTAFGACVTVIAPAYGGPTENITWERRPYARGDLTGALLAVAATNDRGVNRQVGEEAMALGIPASIADRQEECTFFFPAICQSEGLTAGIVSHGGDHKRTVAAACAVRRALEELP